MHRVLEAGLRLRTGRLHDGPRVLPFAYRKHVKVVVFDSHIWLLSFDSTKDEDALVLDLIPDEIPLYFR